MYQDSLGFIWINTVNGICRYDGSRFVSYGRDKGVQGFVFNIYEPKKGYLILSQLDGRRSAYYMGELIDSKTSDYSIDAFEKVGSKVYVSTDKGFGEWKTDSVAFFTGDKLNIGYIKAIDSTHLFFFDNKRKKYYLSDGAFNRKDSIAGNEMCSYYVGPNKDLWFGDATTIKKFNWQHLMHYQLKATDSIGVKTLTSPYYPRVMVDAYDNVWICSWFGLMVYTNKSKLIKPFENAGIPRVVAYSAFVDREHNVWVGTSEGIVKIQPMDRERKIPRQKDEV